MLYFSDMYTNGREYSTQNLVESKGFLDLHCIFYFMSVDRES
jgi:hypothetical protein